MKTRSFLILSVPVLLLIGCIETIVEPGESGFPSKLYPYESVYDAATYKACRDNLLMLIPSNSLAVVATNDLYRRNGDIDYEFRPTSSFYYLTGFDEPRAVALIRRKGGNPTASELVLFVQTREGEAVRWMGPVYGPEEAVKSFGADSAYAFENLGSLLRFYLKTGSYQRVFTAVESNQGVSDTVLSAIGGAVPTSSISATIDSLRSIKSSLELKLIQYAVDVSVQSFKEGMKAVKPGKYEYEVQAVFDYVQRTNGCPRSAFPAIIASGPNINILHYQANSRRMLDGDLVMIDYGAEYGYYAADITRTLPVNGKFSPEQTTIYNIVLNAHRAVLAAAKHGVSYYALYTMSRDMIIDGLIQHGVIQGNRTQIISSGAFRKYIPAGLGHPVGLDVHDPFPRETNGDRILKENMVMAFEPHIYLSAGDQTVAQRFWNVSARIEDVALITRTGCKVMSSSLPIEIPEIEALMK